MLSLAEAVVDSLVSAFRSYSSAFSLVKIVPLFLLTFSVEDSVVFFSPLKLFWLLSFSGLTEKVRGDHSFAFYFPDCTPLAPPVLMVQKISFRYSEETVGVKLRVEWMVLAFLICQQ